MRGIQSRVIKENPIKKTASGIFLVIVLFLMLFPFINTLNQLLVRIIEPFIFFKPVQDAVVPYQVRMVRVILGLVGIPMTAGDPWAQSITLITPRGEEPIVVGWNCLGWQSLLIIGVTFITGLQGRFTLLSKLEVLLLGLLGTFLLNIGRLAGVFILFYYGNRGIAMTFHNYGSVILTIFWLFFLWWFAFNFILKQDKRDKD